MMIKGVMNNLVHIISRTWIFTSLGKVLGEECLGRRVSVCLTL